MRELSLFTGAGGGLLGTHGILGWECRGYVEFNEYCQRVIRERINEGILDEAPIFTDVREFVESGAAGQYRGHIDVVTGGFPCQPFSVAGKRRAADDERNMWPATIAVVHAVRPRFVFLENVPGLLTGSHGYFGTVLGDLAEAGYDARWLVLGADDVGAPHRRKRLWIMADSHEQRLPESGVFAKQSGGAEIISTSEIREGCEMDHAAGSGLQGAERSKSQGDGKRPAESGQESMAHADSRGSGQDRGAGELWSGGLEQSPEDSWCSDATEGREVKGWWDIDPADTLGYSDSARELQQEGLEQKVGGWSEYTSAELFIAKAFGSTESVLGRVAYGVAHRVDRLKALGNGQVPLVAAVAAVVLLRDFGYSDEWILGGVTHG